mmetsp:Transcript_18855/g.40585  ORF Transcript_18855/g.40585 Transcript_18855/m.40585 type:complete len:446 (+) Transcript_18855:103-1440(+)
MGPFSRRKKDEGGSSKNSSSGGEERGDGSLSLQPQDVLVGRGKGAYLSEGNKRYMLLVNQFLPVYRRATNNQEKIEITKAVVAHVKRNGGRFMGVDSKGNLNIVSDHVARIKVGQAIRRRRRQVDGDAPAGGWIGSSTSQQTESERTLPSHRSVEGTRKQAATVSLRSAAEDASYRSVGDRSVDESYRSDGASYRSVGASQRSYRERTAEDVSPYVPQGTAAASYEQLTSMWDNSWSLERTFEDDDEDDEDPSPYIPRTSAQQRNEQSASQRDLAKSADELLSRMPNMSINDTLDPALSDALEPTPIAPTHQHVQAKEPPPATNMMLDTQQLLQHQQHQNLLAAQQQALATMQQQQAAVILSSGLPQQPIQQPMTGGTSYVESVPSMAVNPAMIQSQMNSLANQHAAEMAMMSQQQQQQPQQQLQFNQPPLGPGGGQQGNFSGTS